MKKNKVKKVKTFAFILTFLILVTTITNQNQKILAENNYQLRNLKALPYAQNSFTLESNGDYSFIKNQPYIFPFNLDQSKYDSYVDLEWEAPFPSSPYTNYKLWQQQGNITDYKQISTKYDQNIRVLNIYPLDKGSTNVNKGPNMVKNWVARALASDADIPNDLISVTPVYINDFNNDATNYLYNSDNTVKYDVVFIGAADSNGSKDLTVQSAQIMQNYVDAGNGVLLGHDTMLYRSNGKNNMYNQFSDDLLMQSSKEANVMDYINSKYKLGLKNSTNWNVTSISSYDGSVKSKSLIKVAKDGYITRYPFIIPIGTTLSVPFTHTNDQFAGGDVWMSFENQKATTHSKGNLIEDAPMTFAGPITITGTNNFYLTSYKNIAMIQTGHSYGQSTNDENKVLVNVLAYLAQNTTQTIASDYTVQDINPPTIPIVKYTLNNADINNPTIDLTISSQDTGTITKYKTSAEDDQQNSKTSDIISGEVVSGLRGFVMNINGSTPNLSSVYSIQEADTYNASATDTNDRVRPNDIKLNSTNSDASNTSISPDKTLAVKLDMGINEGDEILASGKRDETNRKYVGTITKSIPLSSIQNGSITSLSIKAVDYHNNGSNMITIPLSQFKTVVAIAKYEDGTFVDSTLYNQTIEDGTMGIGKIGTNINIHAPKIQGLELTTGQSSSISHLITNTGTGQNEVYFIYKKPEIIESHILEDGMYLKPNITHSNTMLTSGTQNTIDITKDSNLDLYYTCIGGTVTSKDITTGNIITTDYNASDLPINLKYGVDLSIVIKYAKIPTDVNLEYYVDGVIDTTSFSPTFYNTNIYAGGSFENAPPNKIGYVLEKVENTTDNNTYSNGYKISKLGTSGNNTIRYYYTTGMASNKIAVYHVWLPSGITNPTIDDYKILASKYVDIAPYSTTTGGLSYTDYNPVDGDLLYNYSYNNDSLDSYTNLQGDISKFDFTGYINPIGFDLSNLGISGLNGAYDSKFITPIGADVRDVSVLIYDSTPQTGNSQYLPVLIVQHELKEAPVFRYDIGRNNDGTYEMINNYNQTNINLSGLKYGEIFDLDISNTSHIVNNKEYIFDYWAYGSENFVSGNLDKGILDNIPEIAKNTDETGGSIHLGFNSNGDEYSAGNTIIGVMYKEKERTEVTFRFVDEDGNSIINKPELILKTDIFNDGKYLYEGNDFQVLDANYDTAIEKYKETLSVDEAFALQGWELDDTIVNNTKARNSFVLESPEYNVITYVYRQVKTEVTVEHYKNYKGSLQLYSSSNEIAQAGVPYETSEIQIEKYYLESVDHEEGIIIPDKTKANIVTYKYYPEKIIEPDKGDGGTDNGGEIIENIDTVENDDDESDEETNYGVDSTATPSPITTETPTVSETIEENVTNIIPTEILDANETEDLPVDSENLTQTQEFDYSNIDINNLPENAQIVKGKYIAIDLGDGRYLILDLDGTPLGYVNSLEELDKWEVEAISKTNPKTKGTHNNISVYTLLLLIGISLISLNINRRKTIMK